MQNHDAAISQPPSPGAEFDKAIQGLITFDLDGCITEKAKRKRGDYAIEEEEAW